MPRGQPVVFRATVSTYARQTIQYPWPVGQFDSPSASWRSSVLYVSYGAPGGSGIFAAGGPLSIACSPPGFHASRLAPVLGQYNFNFSRVKHEINASKLRCAKVSAIYSRPASIRSRPHHQGRAPQPETRQKPPFATRCPPADVSMVPGTTDRIPPLPKRSPQKGP